MRQSLYDFCIENRRPELLGEWDTETNRPLTPQTISRGSSRLVGWICSRGHRWTAKVDSRASGHTGCPVCAGKKILPGVNDLRTLEPAVAAQWNAERNAPLRPEELSPHAHRKVWWRCGACGSEWQAAINARTGTQRNGCPVCAGRKIVPGVNDLASAYPQLAVQWHPTKNGALTPQEVAPGTLRKAWWRCPQGHEWQASIASRTTNGLGCPVCSGQKAVPGVNDLASRFPLLAAQWDAAANGALTPSAVTSSSNRMVHWRCPQGHAYRARIVDRTGRGHGCPYCAGRKVLAGFNDLGTLQPKIAAQWHPELNGALTPQQVTVGSKKKVWWQCEEGHVWQAVVYSRTGKGKCGCPVCAGKGNRARQYQYQQILREASPQR